MVPCADGPLLSQHDIDTTTGRNQQRGRRCDLTYWRRSRAFPNQAANQPGWRHPMGIGTDFVLWIGAMNLVTLCAVVLAVRGGGFGDR